MIELESKTVQVSTFKGETRWYFHSVENGRVFEQDYETTAKARDQWLAENAKKYAVLFMTRIDFPAVSQADPCL